MKVLFVNALDSGGGAAQAALRLLHAVRAKGVDAWMLVQVRRGDDPHVLGPRTCAERILGRVAPVLDSKIADLRARRRHGFFSPAMMPDLVAERADQLAPDVIHLHWVGFGMLRVETLQKFRRPIVWTLHDSWPFTGGCHVPFDLASGLPCERHEAACGRCPVLGSPREHDLSRAVWSRKKRAWRGIDLTAVAPSRWLAERARSSSLLSRHRIEVIPNGLDLVRYSKLDQDLARATLRLSPGKKLVVFGAQAATTDANKGFPLLASALRALGAHPLGNEIELVVFGSGPPSPFVDLPCKATYLGWLKDERTLNLVYAAADVVVVPSLLENLPFTIMEAMACGTPVVAFRQGGVSDLIDHLENGFLAKPYDPVDLAAGIAWVLAGPSPREHLCAAARAKVASAFDAPLVAERYVTLYHQVIEAHLRTTNHRAQQA